MLLKSQSLFRGLALAVAIASAPGIVQAGGAIEGKLVADQRGHISAQMTGERSQRVKDMLVRVGDKVKAGDLLARLDTEQLEADRLIAQRALEEAQASVKIAISNVAKAKLDYDRRAGLKDSPSFNRAAYEDAQVALQAAESELESAKSSANRREAEVARIDLEIRLADIKAPYDGLVLDVLTSVGASVTQKDPNLLTLLDLSQVEIAVALPQDRAKALRLGQNVGYTLADGEQRTARLRAVLPPTSPKEPTAVARLQLIGTDLPATILNQQSVQVYLDE